MSQKMLRYTLIVLVILLLTTFSVSSVLAGGFTPPPPPPGVIVDQNPGIEAMDSLQPIKMDKQQLQKLLQASGK